MDVYLELGRRRAFAAGVDWPGWCRSGAGEEAALKALARYRPRYAAVVQTAAPEFDSAEQVAALRVVERLPGDATTDFGAPGAIPAVDERTIASAELERLVALLRCCWSAFESAAAAGRGRKLATGPRGGGRLLEQMREHVEDAQRSYLRQLGAAGPAAAGGENWSELQAAFVDALRASERGELAERGPRGGRRWPPRYAVRRSAWHALDHAWELEDRLVGA